jgi:hypothetical protein
VGPSTIAPTSLPSESPTTIEPTSSPVVSEFLEFGQEYLAPPLGSSRRTIQGRMVARFDPTDCTIFDSPLMPPPQTNRPYPGTGGNSTQFYEVIGPFKNPNSDLTCIAVDVDPGVEPSASCLNGPNPLIIVGAFTQFNPLNIEEGYLGDIANVGEFPSFAFNVQGDAEFYIVGQQFLANNNAVNGVDCVFSVTVNLG